MTVHILDAREVVVLEDRQRTYMDAGHVMALQGSMVDVGMLHPIVVEFVEGEARLLAGECRLRAVIQAGEFDLGIKFRGETLEPFQIACTDIPNLDDVMRQEIEFAENRDRLDLSWQDRDRAFSRIAMLKGLEVGPASAKAVAETMNELMENPPKLLTQTRKAKDALVREQFAHLPQVAKAKSAEEANKAIKKHLHSEKMRRLAEEFQESKTPHQILKGDCCEVIKTLDDKVFDVVLADPIYGINMHEQNAFQREKIQEGNRHDYDDSWENFDRMFQVMPAELYRVCKDDAALYIFCGINRFFTSYVKGEKGQPIKLVGLAERFRKAGWNVWPRPLVWYKGNIGSLPVPDAGPR